MNSQPMNSQSIHSAYERLGLSAPASPEQVKAAYHAKLREFPAHTHPEDFKIIRAAYETLRKNEANKDEDFLKVRPLEVTFDPELLNQLRRKASAHLEVSIDDFIRETF